MMQSTPWKPCRRQWDWRAYLTDAERVVVVNAEIRSSEAKKALFEATALLSPIRNRAVQRAKFDAARAEPKSASDA